MPPWLPLPKDRLGRFEQTAIPLPSHICTLHLFCCAKKTRDHPLGSEESAKVEWASPARLFRFGPSVVLVR
jgi:hypothetical protein